MRAVQCSVAHAGNRVHTAEASGQATVHAARSTSREVSECCAVVASYAPLSHAIGKPTCVTVNVAPTQHPRRALLITAAGPAQKAAPALHMLFETPDLDATYAKAVAAGAVSLEPPKLRSCGRYQAYVRDPHGGVLIELLQELPYPFFLGKNP